MSTKKICNTSGRAALLLVAASYPLGCGFSQGQALYFLGFGRRETVKAEYRLTKEPILILVDDLSGQTDWPPTLGYLTDDLGQELIKGRGADRIIPRETLNNVRRARNNYNQISAQRLGRECGAEQVLWLEVERYFGNSEFYEPTHAAWFAVNVKVLNVNERTSRSRVRLWPIGPRGRYISVSLDGSAVSRLKTKDAIAKALAEKLSGEITKLFTDHVPGDFED